MRRLVVGQSVKALYANKGLVVIGVLELKHVA